MEYNDRNFAWNFWRTLMGVVNAFKIQPHSQGKHAKGTTKPKNWREHRKMRRQMAAASRKINRGN
jgi:hypothetical protein